ncbi:hypothetical protein CCACVL1_07038 [Corchorus capsularis]|uniref:Protein kinase domain-containing protein n=1 Tax=Corchorus capsularis TaxID=210143 RepID=A0A1R3JA84_COCAP|nr:hypothetical protein CCACVL1_07038 [Corchorus capsularis]
MKPEHIKEISLEDLKLYTCNFSNDNLIGNFQFGKVFRGKINGDHHVTVKVWMPQTLYTCFPGDNEIRLQAELIILTETRVKLHPNLPKLIGYCGQGQLAVVYDLNPIDTLQNFILRDDFTWLQRIKVALQLACLLQILHYPPPSSDQYLVRNISPAHIVLDKDYNLVLYDFGMFTGGSLPEVDKENPGRRHLHGCIGYIDGYLSWTDKWFPEMDVFSFGVILIGLIAKKVFIVEDHSALIGLDLHSLVDWWAIKEYERRKSVSGENASLVHQTLEADGDFEYADGVEVTKLAMECLEPSARDRILIDVVVEDLLKLHVVRDTFSRWALSRL